MRLPEFRIDSVFIFCLTAIVFTGLLNLYSATESHEMLFARHAGATLIGSILCFGMAHTDYRHLRKYSAFFYVLGVITLLLTWKFGHEVKATRSWINLGIFSVQPSELFKGVFILHLSAYLGKIRQGRQINFVTGLVLPVVILFIPVGLILLQKDVGTAIVYIPIFFILLFMADLHFTIIGMSLWVGLFAGLRACLRIFWQMPHPPAIPLLKYLSYPVSGLLFAAGLAVGLILLVIRLRVSHFRGGAWTRLVLTAWIILFAGLWTGDRLFHALKPHQKTRIASFFMPSVDPQGSSYQAQQAQIAIGSGGIFGKGYTKGTQKGLGFLPEQTTDFAFSVLAEEWGFMGSAGLLLLYGGLIGSTLQIARHATELYGCLLSAGAATLFFVHTTIGLAMNLGLFPVIGIPMPFLSYGGSAQVLNLAMAGLVISVSRHRRLLAA